MSEKELFDKLDDYIAGSLGEAEKTELEAFWNSDPVLKQKAEEHLRLLRDVKFYGRRRELRKTLHEIHSHVPVESSEQRPPLMTVKTAIRGRNTGR